VVENHLDFSLSFNFGVFYQPQQLKDSIWYSKMNTLYIKIPPESNSGGIKVFYSDGGVVVSSGFVGFLPHILSTEDKPKHPKANIATASTNGVDGAMCSSVKLF
jgi:hypothetical protein